MSSTERCCQVGEPLSGHFVIEKPAETIKGKIWNLNSCSSRARNVSPFAFTQEEGRGEGDEYWEVVRGERKIRRGMRIDCE